MHRSQGSLFPLVTSAIQTDGAIIIIRVFYSIIQLMKNSNSLEDSTLQNTENIDKSNLQVEEGQEALMDFTDMFKSSKVLKTRITAKKKEASAQNEQNSQHIQNVVPRNLAITQEQMKERRCLDLRRWYCLSRPQYQRTCGISSVVTVWNYLFSTLGTGLLPPISQEEAIVALNLTPEVGPHFNDVEFGSFSGNMALMTWFKNLCRLRNVKGRAFYMWKDDGESCTKGVDRDLALQKLCSGLKTETTAFIYHAYDHYFCPIGYEITPNKAIQAYSPEIDLADSQYWIIIAEPAKPYPFFTVRKWVDIATDIELKLPKYMNIRKMDEGVKEYKNAYGASQHCLMQFERIESRPRKKMDRAGTEKQQVKAEVTQCETGGSLKQAQDKDSREAEAEPAIQEALNDEESMLARKTEKTEIDRADLTQQPQADEDAVDVPRNENQFDN